MASETSDLIQVPAQIIGLNPRQDRSWVIKAETRELSGDQVKILADHFQGEGWLVYSPNEISMKDIPKENAESGAKSPSQRLRDRIYILYKEKDIKVDFESFYRTMIERFIEQVQEKIDA